MKQSLDFEFLLKWRNFTELMILIQITCFYDVPQARLRGHKLQKIELTVSTKFIKLVDVNLKVREAEMIIDNV